jgi:hypothetical protein
VKKTIDLLSLGGGSKRSRRQWLLKKAEVVECSAKSSAEAVIAQRRQWSLRGGSDRSEKTVVAQRQ